MPTDLGASGWGCSWGPVGWEDGRWESEPNEDSRGGIELSVVEVAWQGLVEVEVGRRLGLGGIEARRLVDREISLRRPASGRERRGPVGEVEVQKNGGDDGRVGEKGEDLHGAAAGRTEERQDLIDPGEEHGPADPRRAG